MKSIGYRSLDRVLILVLRISPLHWSQPGWFNLISTWPERLDSPDPTRLNANSDRIQLNSIVTGTDRTRTRLSKLTGFWTRLPTRARLKLNWLNLVSFSRRPEPVRFLQGTAKPNRLGETRLNAFIWWSCMSPISHRWLTSNYSPLRVGDKLTWSKPREEQPLRKAALWPRRAGLRMNRAWNPCSRDFQLHLWHFKFAWCAWFKVGSWAAETHSSAQISSGSYILAG